MSETTEGESSPASGRYPQTESAAKPEAAPPQATEEPHAVAEEQAVAEPDSPPSTLVEGRTTVMLLGSGELSRELALAFQRIGGGVIAVDALDALAERRHVEVFPTVRSTRLSLDREGMRRLAADELGLPTAPSWFAGSVEELTAVAEHAGFPLVVKPIVAVPGEGESVLLRHDDVEPAWQRAVAAGRITHNRVLVETIVEIDFEVTMLTIRTTGQSGPTVSFCEPVGHRQVDGDVMQAWQPQHMPAPPLGAAKSISARIVNALGGRGVFGVELLVRGEEVYFADVRARPHDTGLVTLRSQRLSEFELHARAILGLPVDTIMISPGAAEVTYGGTESADPQGDAGKADVNAVLAEALDVPESDVRLFGRPEEAYARRRLGVALATGTDVTAARDRVRRVSAALRKLW